MLTTTKSRWLLILLALLASLSLFLAACGGDSDDDEDTDEVATETEDAGDDEEEEDPTEDADDDKDSGDGRSDLEKLAASGEQTEGVVTYTIVSADSPESQWKVYQLDDNSRVDFSSSDGTFTSITTPKASYYCTESGGTGTCFSGEGGLGVNPFQGLFDSYGSYESIVDSLETYSDTDVDTSTEEIAGVDAACYAVSGGDVEADGVVKWCFSESGLLLLSSYEIAGGEFEMKAVEFSEDVSESDFEPPYEITEIPGF